MDLTIGDNKLYHSNRHLRDVGIQITVFRGIEIGPIMNKIGCDQNGVILSVNFIHHGDGPFSIIESFLQKMGYGEENTLKHSMET